MKLKEVIGLVCMSAALLTLFGLSRSHVEAYRTDYTYRLHVAASPLPIEAVNALAGEFKGMVANYLLLEAASFIGGKQDATTDDWNAVTRLLDQSNSLDPYFKQTYRLAQATLPWQAQKYDQTLTILERSREHLPWDWQPGFFIGFDYFYFLKDNLTASRKLMEASRINGAPLSLSTLASRLSSQAGHTKAAIDFLIAVYENTDDEEAREVLKLRILALQGVLVLQAAVDRFNSQFDRMPRALDELIEKGVIQALPQNPYNRPFSLRDGKVDF
jgi:predicted negative regulator of RcsB-dependent stress response